MQDNGADGLSLAAVVHQATGGGIDIFGTSKDVKVSAADRSAAAIATGGSHGHANAKAVIGDFDGTEGRSIFDRHGTGFALDSRLLGVVVEHKICIKCHNLFLSLKVRFELSRDQQPAHAGHRPSQIISFLSAIWTPTAGRPSGLRADSAA